MTLEIIMRESEDGCSLARVVAVLRKRAGLDFRRRITRLMAGEASLVGVELGPIMTPRDAITGKGKVNSRQLLLGKCLCR